MSQRLLIIDDEPPIRFALARYFGSFGCVVDTAGTVEEAETLIAAADYQAAIIDVRLSRGDDGLALAGVLRNRYPEAKLVLLTAYGSADLEAEAREQGVDAVLNKPKPLADIAAVLEVLLSEPLGSCRPRVARSWTKQTGKGT